MGFLLSILDTVILLFIHTKVLGQRLTPRKAVIATALFYVVTVLFVGVFEFTGWDYIIGALLIYPVYFILYTLSMGKLGNRLSLLFFYSLFPLGFWDVVKNFIGYFIIYNHPVLHRFYQTSLGVTIFSLLAKIVVLVLISIFRYDFSYLKTRALDSKTRLTLVIVNSFMLAYFILPPYMSYIDQESWAKMTDYQELLTAVYFLLFICFVNLLDRDLRQELQEQVMLQKEIQLQNINNYSKQVEGLYQEVRSFRHDYANILASLKIGIDQQDINLISEVYENVLRDSGNKLKGKRFDVAQLRNINDLSLKSLLLSKLSEAQNLFVPVSLEIPEPISIRNMEQIDFLTITSILLDNAIEAAAEATAEAGLVVCFLEDIKWNKLVMIVKNSTLEREVELEDIFKLHFSSKGEGRGIGLYNVRSILKAYPGACLKTASKNHIFTQIVEIDL